MIVIDTSALIDTFCDPRHSLRKFRMLVDAGDEIVLSAVVLYEWLRGPRTHLELLDQEQAFPRERAMPFGAVEASRAADLYKTVKHARGREIDLAIAATALVHDAALWTLNPDDFRDIASLHLV
ncbi:MAG TPA: type II toxin-antitoxin system VapC family toxin [Thermoanaerobaculia bacterium]